MHTTSTCRLCTAYCPIVVTVEDGVVTDVHGDRDAPLYEGYTCPKGRALPAVHTNPRRLLHSLRRRPDGAHEPISSADAVAEIAARLADVVERHGPESVAMYIGTFSAAYPATGSVASALLQALGSPNVFSAATIDQPGMIVADSYHGIWLGGRTPFDEADAWLFVGTNPVISKQYLSENPARRLNRAIERGTKIVVVDPRRTETARRAHVHLQPRPGEDAAIIAGLIHLILREGWVDTEFVRAHARGLDELAAAVAPFTPEAVAQRADVPAGQLLDAARVLGTARRGGAGGGTGASMSNPGPLVPYLLLCLTTVRGFWAREGDRVDKPNVLLPRNRARAQAHPPYHGAAGARRMRVRGLEKSAAGLPTGALAEEILTPGPGQIRALFNVGGGPAMAWPDERLARRALEDLELFVTTDVEYSPTAQLADYVVATKMTLETPGVTQRIESIKYFHFGYGFSAPYAQYSPAVVDPPQGSDLIEDWQLYYRIAQHLSLPLNWVNVFGIPGAYMEAPVDVVPLDMEHEPTTDDLYELMCRGSNVPLAEVKQYPHGHVFEHLLDERVGPADAGSAGRLDIGNAVALAGLAAPVRAIDGDKPFLLVPRRDNRMINSTGRTVPGLMGGRPYNPAFLHPDDLSALGLTPGDTVEIRSDGDVVTAVVEADADLRPGVLSISHGFGAGTADEE
ncbi:MAG TPA: molybdopterin-dependent oxidoreductase, partial [Acidimicrobiales bacterium]|nr:molybdopterin-dependent oxidoreductase [Acidimicrobiales bacterium]